MALGTNNMITGDYGDFIPQMWSNEVIGAYKTNLVVARLVVRINHVGQKGSVINIPSPARGSAYAKAASTQVTLNNPSESAVSVTINKHYEYSFLYEDLLSLQALNSLRKFYTNDAGYALAKQVDQDLFLLAATANGGTTSDDWANAVLGSDGATAFADASGGNAAELTDVGIRKMIQTLDDQDVPMMNRAFVVPPVEKNNILGIARFTEQAFVGNGESIRTGQIADLYENPVYVTTNCPWIHMNSVTNTTSTTFSSSAPTGSAYVDALGNTVDWATSTPSDVTARVGMYMHKEAFALAEQMDVRSQVQYKQEYLADLFTADTVYGVAELRDGSCLPFVVPS